MWFHKIHLVFWNMLVNTGSKEEHLKHVKRQNEDNLPIILSKCHRARPQRKWHGQNFYQTGILQLKIRAASNLANPKLNLLSFQSITTANPYKIQLNCVTHYVHFWRSRTCLPKCHFAQSQIKWRGQLPNSAQLCRPLHPLLTTKLLLIVEHQKYFY